MPLRLLSLPLALAALVLTLALPAAALADTYTYTYTGATFTNLIDNSGPQTLALTDYITYSVTFTQALPSDMGLGYVNGVLAMTAGIWSSPTQEIASLSWTVTPYSDFDTPAFETSGGVITGWSFQASTYEGSPEYSVFSESFPQGAYYDDASVGGSEGRSVPADGTWTLTDNPPPATTPEPTSLVLAGTGLFGLAAFTRRRRLLKPAAALAIAAAAALIPSTARADTTYDYTGSAFTTLTTSGGASQVYSTGDSVTGSVTLAAPLGDNFTFADPVTPVAFSFSDGVQTISNTSPGLDTTFFQFQTNASGAITAWAIDVYTGPNGAQDEIRINSNTGDFGIDHTTGASAYAEGSTTVAGSFSPAATVATPEPTSLILAGSGLFGLAAFTRRRLSPGCPTSRF